MDLVSSLSNLFALCLLCLFSSILSFSKWEQKTTPPADSEGGERALVKWRAGPTQTTSNVMLSDALTLISHGTCQPNLVNLVWQSRVTLSCRDNFAQCRQSPFISTQTMQKRTCPLGKTVSRDPATDISCCWAFLDSPDGPWSITMITVNPLIKHLMNTLWCYSHYFSILPILQHLGLPSVTTCSFHNCGECSRLRWTLSHPLKKALRCLNSLFPTSEAD